MTGEKPPEREFGIPDGDVGTGKTRLLDQAGGQAAGQNTAQAQPLRGMVTPEDFSTKLSNSFIAALSIGIILSIVIFCITTQISDEVIASRNLQREQTVYRLIRDQILRVDRNFTVLDGLIDTNTGNLPANTQEILNGLDPQLGQLYHMHRLPDGRWITQPLRPVAAERQKLIDSSVFDPATTVYKELVSRLSSSVHKFFVVPVPSMPSRVSETQTSKLDALSFVMARRVGMGLGNDIILIVATWPDLLGETYMSRIPGLHRVTISVPKAGGKPLLTHETDWSESALSALLPNKWRTQTNMLKHELGDQSLETLVTFVPDDSELMLRMMPFLLMLVCLTVTGFVANNIQVQKLRSRELKAMNRKLSQRYGELQARSKESERLESSIQRTERNSLAIVNAVHEVIFEVDGAGTFTFLNNAWTKITGLDVSQCLGKDIFSFVMGADKVDKKRHFDMLVHGQRPVFSFNADLEKTDGTGHPVEIIFSMLRQDYNRELRVIGTINSIADRVAAESRAMEKEKQYRAIWESAPIGLYQLSPTGKFISVNPAMAEILGYDDMADLQNGVRQAHVDLYLASRDRLQFLQSLDDSATLAGASEFELRRKDGSTIWGAETVRIMRNADGTIKAYEGTLTDVTTAKTTQMALQKATWESDVANRAKTEFLANIGHELRTPLNSVIGFSEIIRNQSLGAIENKNYVEYAGEILDSGRRLLKIINQILDIARIDTRERQLNDGIVRIPTIVNSSLDLLRSKVEEKHLTIKNTIPVDMPDIIGEDLAFRQMLFNLISNAVKFTPDAGQITISHFIDPVQGCRISISDTGLGLDQEEIARALTPFGLVEGSHARENYGIGLGLTLVRLLIDLHDGQLDIFSQKGVGTTVSIIIPPSRVRENATRLAPTFDKAEDKGPKAKSTAQSLAMDVTGIDMTGADVFAAPQADKAEKKTRTPRKKKS
jgi:PAS domain S-box-containing protein